MAHYSLLNNDERGDIETFLAASVQCDYCHAEAIVHLDDAVDGTDQLRHTRNCAARFMDGSPVSIVPLDWYYALGSEGFNWVDEPEGPYRTEAEAKVDAAEKVAGLPPAGPLPVPRSYRPTTYHEALGAFEASRARVARCHARLDRCDLAMRNAAYALEFLAYALPKGWRRDRAAGGAERLRETIREEM